MMLLYRVHRHSKVDAWPSVYTRDLGLPRDVKNRVSIPAHDPFTENPCTVHGTVSQNRLYLNKGWESERIWPHTEDQGQTMLVMLDLAGMVVEPPLSAQREEPPPRPTRDQTMILVAVELGRRSTCRRRAVGAVLVDALGRILSTGYNGTPMGDVHCLDQPCPGADLPSGVGLDQCHAVHAEINALLFCPDVMKIDTCYVTTSPCTLCLRALLNTSCHRIVYDEVYSQEAIEWWTSRGRTAEQTW
jgi:dCMP deaminase